MAGKSISKERVLNDAAGLRRALKAAADKASKEGAYTLGDALAAPQGTHPDLDRFVERMKEADRLARHVHSLDERVAKNGVVALVRHLRNAAADPAIAESHEGAGLVKLLLAILEPLSPLTTGDEVGAVLAKAGASVVGRDNGMKPHTNHAKASARLPELWTEMKADGKSKNEAAALIADRLGLAETTVRKKLQGLR